MGWLDLHSHKENVGLNNLYKELAFIVIIICKVKHA